MSQPMQSLRDEQDEDQSIGHKPIQLPVDTQVSPTPLQLGGQAAASSSSSVRTRGPNLGQPTPVNPKNMTNDKIKGPCGRYMWYETEEQNVHLAWDKLGKDRFRDILNRARNEMLVKHKKSDIAYLHNLGPNWMKVEVWNELVAYWSSQEWQKKSQSAKINRMIVKDGSITKHAGGSIKIEIHEDRLTKKLGKPPNKIEVFRATHTKKGTDGVFIDSKSRRVDVRRLCKCNCGEICSNSESPLIFDMDKWIEVSGGFNKGRVYGFGSSAKSQTSGSSTSQSCTSAYPGSSSQLAMTQEEIQQLIDEKTLRMRAEMMA
ncbi:hypothetical protein GH714_034857 [Hevea brasiliensis]|uniref:Uncharacterized protein n=1 Tax=Hevea brasiliensis TaxID=3981 RepID=A0A6A6NE38_HEVBR|nr:hypothetical protein GH714_034857 [Hevea brasiliensis]